MQSRQSADILVVDAAQNPILAVDVKNRESLSRDIATTLRRNFTAHGSYPSAPYFLLLSQDRAYLWKHAEARRYDAPPDVEFPVRDVIQRYRTAFDPARRMRGEELQQIIANWLLDLADASDHLDSEPENALREAGVTDAIRGGAVLTQARAW